MFKTGCEALKKAGFVTVLILGGSGPAVAGLDETIADIKSGNYSQAFNSLLEPLKAAVDDGTRALELGTCSAIAATMPPVERGIAVFEALLGDIYYMGHGVPKDYAAAFKWYKRAADKGNALSQSTLGDIYYYGFGVPQNYVLAAKWWQLAADQGVHVAQLNLSVMYANGNGVKTDLVKSHMYANLAASGFPPGKDRDTAVSNRNYLAGTMTPEQIAEAQKMAEQWKAKSAATAPGGNPDGPAVEQESLETSDGKAVAEGELQLADREKIICRW
ncbi:MAG: sel1 repeat family protein [Rhodospirillales bacterium]|nr:sel1 repeat family protein [Rhodospirillales bacterium]